jgi:hypothetical protein
MAQLPILLGSDLSPIQGPTIHCHQQPPPFAAGRHQPPSSAACRHSPITFPANSKKKKKPSFEFLLAYYVVIYGSIIGETWHNMVRPFTGSTTNFCFQPSLLVAAWPLMGLTDILRSPTVSFILLAQCGLALHRIDS